MKPFLSICIPTYNRGAFIGETLESIISQATDEVEIVVSDNASQDDTRHIVESFRGRFPRITYFRWPENMGADRNFLKVVELAKGEYCWFMGSDDIAEQGGVRQILTSLKKFENIAGMSLNIYAYSPDMSHRIVTRPITGGKLKSTVLLNGCEEIFSILGDYFGYISGQVVNKSLWDEIVTEYELSSFYNAYIHIYVIGRMLQKKPCWLYVHDKCVGWRSGNDSFLAEGRLRRLRIDVEGYEKIAAALFGKFSRPYGALLSTVSTVHVRYAVMGAKLDGLPVAFFMKAFSTCLRTYWMLPKFWLITVPVFAIPSLAFRAARQAYRLTMKKKYRGHSFGCHTT